MDFMTILGLGLGVTVVYSVLAYGNLLALLVNPTAFFLIAGGSVASIMMAHPWSAIKQVPMAVKLMFFPPKNIDPMMLVRQLMKLAVQANQKGPEDLSLEEPFVHPFIEEAVKMLSEGLDEESVRERLQRDIHLTHQRRDQLTEIFRSGGAFAPIFGLLGTLIGIIQVLRNISDTEGMGSAMAIAMISSFYGIFCANFVFLPMATKLAYHADEDVTAKEVIARGIMSIQQGEAPWLVYKRLEVFLATKLRKGDQKEMWAG